MARAILLFSGGLDSILAAHILKREGVELIALYFYTVFSSSSYEEEKKRLTSFLKFLKIPLEIEDFSEEHIKMVKTPRYGYGENLNPCVDCKIFMFRKASRYMEELKASFIVTGEVLGERPMSQRRDIFHMIERESGLRGKILRPLSARLLSPTVVEESGIVKRDNLYAISGRGRKVQMKLTEEFGISNYPTPSGGCLLTNPSFCLRLRDLMKYCPGFEVRDVVVLKIGRHFRISPEAKLIVARDEKESSMLMDWVYPGTLKFFPLTGKGPVGIGVGRLTEENINFSSQIVASYCKDTSSEIAVKVVDSNRERMIKIKKDLLSLENIRRHLIC